MKIVSPPHLPLHRKCLLGRESFLLFGSLMPGRDWSCCCCSWSYSLLGAMWVATRQRATHEALPLAAQPFLNSALLRPMARCGMHSLELFCFGVLLSFAAHALLVETSAGPALQVMISAAGISLMIAVATLIAWWGSLEEGKGASRQAASDAIRRPAAAPAAA